MKTKVLITVLLSCFIMSGISFACEPNPPKPIPCVECEDGVDGANGKDATVEGAIAGSLAVASIHQARIGKSMIGIGLGNYRDGNAIALGISKSIETDKYFDEVSLGLNAFYSKDTEREDVGFGSSINFHF